jgi:hypothetical protein
MRRLITSGALALAIGLGVFGGAAYKQASVVRADDGGEGGACPIPGKRQPTGDGTLTCDCTVSKDTDCQCLVPAPPGGCKSLLD